MLLYGRTHAPQFQHPIIQANHAFRGCQALPLPWVFLATNLARIAQRRAQSLLLRPSLLIATFAVLRLDQFQRIQAQHSQALRLHQDKIPQGRWHWPYRPAALAGRTSHATALAPPQFVRLVPPPWTPFPIYGQGCHRSLVRLHSSIDLIWLTRNGDL